MKTNNFPASGLSRSQIKKLVGHLDRRHVHQRQIDGKVLSYIEGWFAISEANAIFGFDGWSRETLYSERLFEQIRFQDTTCSYSARVRIRVHAGSREICRDGTGTGFATANSRSDAYERALKAAETDATKRALATFGNRFGLSLYNKGQTGLSKRFNLLGPQGEVIVESVSAEAFCGGLRQLIEKSETALSLAALREANVSSLSRLQQDFPDLVSAKGTHFAALINRLYSTKLSQLHALSDTHVIQEQTHPAICAPPDPEPGKIDKSQLAVGRTERRIRDKVHLLLVGSQPCLICGEQPSHAHHLTFAQPRGMSVKVSDEFTVPLCAVHHNLLHMHGGETAFWRQHGIEPLAIAKQLWERLGS